MNIKLGERIKKIRKAKNITQSNLAGDTISKSMLSLIENNQATPSLKTLTYISNKLEMPLSYFLEDTNNDNQINNHIDELKKSFSQFSDLYKNKSFVQAEKKMNEIIENNDFSGFNVIFAEIQTTFGKFLYDIDKFNETEKYFSNAREIYILNDMYSKAAEAHLLIYKKYYHMYDLDKCTKIIEKSYEIYSHSTVPNYIFEVDMLLKKVSHDASLNHPYKKLIEYIEEGFETAKLVNMYRFEELYRIKAMIAIRNKKYEVFEESMEKSLELCKLMNPENITTIYFSLAIGSNLYGKYNKALEYLDLAEKSNMSNIKKITIDFVIYIERLKAYYYLDDFKNVKSLIKEFDIEYYKNKFSFAPEKVFYYTQIIKYSKIINGLGDFSTAINIINGAIEYISNLNLNRELYFAYKALSEIYESTNNYKDSYISLKKANNYLEKFSELDKKFFI